MINPTLKNSITFHIFPEFSDKKIVKNLILFGSEKLPDYKGQTEFEMVLQSQILIGPLSHNDQTINNEA